MDFEPGEYRYFGMVSVFLDFGFVSDGALLSSLYTCSLIFFEPFRGRSGDGDDSTVPRSSIACFQTTVICGLPECSRKILYPVYSHSFPFLFSAYQMLTRFLARLRPLSHDASRSIRVLRDGLKLDRRHSFVQADTLVSSFIFFNFRGVLSYF